MSRMAAPVHNILFWGRAYNGRSAFFCVLVPGLCFKTVFILTDYQNSGVSVTGAGDGTVGLFDVRTAGAISRLPLSSSWEVGCFSLFCQNIVIVL